MKVEGTGLRRASREKNVKIHEGEGKMLKTMQKLTKYKSRVERKTIVTQTYF